MGSLAPLGLGADALGLHPMIIVAVWLMVGITLLSMRLRMGPASSPTIAADSRTGVHTADGYDANGDCPGCRALQASPGWQAYMRVRRRAEGSPA